MRVLFICRANISRSQTAKAFFDTMSKHESESAGVNVGEWEGMSLREHIELRGDQDHVFEIMEKQGLDITGNVRRQVTPEMVERADTVIVLTDKEEMPDFILLSDKTVYWGVDDTLKVPYDFVLEVNRDIRQRVEGLVKEIG